MSLYAEHIPSLVDGAASKFVLAQKLALNWPGSVGRAVGKADVGLALGGDVVGRAVGRTEGLPGG